MLTLKRLIAFLTTILIVLVLMLSGGLLAYSAKKPHKSSTYKKSQPLKIKAASAIKRVKKRRVIKSTVKKKGSSLKVLKKKKQLKYIVKKPRISYTKSDLDLLARLITAESDGEPFNEKVAVGSVIINRIKSHQFATSIKGVIYQKIDGYYQFTPVLNGWINKPATLDAKKAAYVALNGSDPSKGALYYFDDSTKNPWLWSKSIKAQIGKMVFAY